MRSAELFILKCESAVESPIISDGSEGQGWCGDFLTVLLRLSQCEFPEWVCATPVIREEA